MLFILGEILSIRLAPLLKKYFFSVAPLIAFFGHSILLAQAPVSLTFRINGEDTPVTLIKTDWANRFLEVEFSQGTKQRITIAQEKIDEVKDILELLDSPVSFPV